ncbi:uncharacterized protein LOC117188919 [Drosophila miranda]|uniref:uncharacterized protein LOC117188919 n=1 Tax=Drosophila miranda TaxID=7229 RepID=UPI00143F7CD1|nr:uncharacterized protein LOC117188919 [Drosophila miranda]
MADFWRFSFHEHGTYDLPAIIDRMAEVAGGEQESSGADKEEPPRQVLLIGHSQVSGVCPVLPFPKHGFILRSVFRPSMRSWCSARCIRASINASSSCRLWRPSPGCMDRCVSPPHRCAAS